MLSKPLKLIKTNKFIKNIQKLRLLELIPQKTAAIRNKF